MENLLQIENQAAQRELDHFEIVREWRKCERLYDIDVVRPHGTFVWKEFGEDRSPLLGLEQLTTNSEILKSKVQFNAFFMLLMISARDIPEDMQIRIAVNAWNYGKFMRKLFYYKQSYPWSLHYYFDQLKDDYLLMIKDDRRNDLRRYAKLYNDGRLRTITLSQMNVDIEEARIQDILLESIRVNSERIIAKDLIQEVDPENAGDENVLKLYFGFALWNRENQDRTHPNECFTDESRYTFINELLEESILKAFRN